MFFLFSKLLLFLLSPFWWMAMLLTASALSRNKHVKKKMLFIAIAVGIVFSNNFLYQWVVKAYQPERTVIAKQQYTAAILLCGMGGFDTDSNWNFGFAADRFIQTEKLYHTKAINKIVVTGGVGSLNFAKEPDEATAIKKELTACGVKEEDIIIETASRNTFENALFTKKILDSLKVKGPYVLITSALHMPRAAAVFKKSNIATVNLPCNYIGYKSAKDFSYYFPDPQLLTEWQFIIKEMVGYYVYKLSGKI
ncbi:MAG: YdcF family protein [Sphingobacteriia bacterium]|nr:YdcF family protein [Sphingobacteriia bacterium]